MDVIVRSNNNPVNDMTAPVSWLINDLDKAIKTIMYYYHYYYHTITITITLTISCNNSNAVMQMCQKDTTV